MRTNLSNSSFQDQRFDSPLACSHTEKEEFYWGQCQCRKGTSHSLTTGLYWKGRNNSQPRRHRQQQALKKQSYEFQLHKTAEPYVVVSSLLFLVAKASSNTSWHAEDQTLKNRQRQHLKHALFMTIGLTLARGKLEQHDEASTSHVSGQPLHKTLGA